MKNRIERISALFFCLTTSVALAGCSTSADAALEQPVVKRASIAKGAAMKTVPVRKSPAVDSADPMRRNKQQADRLAKNFSPPENSDQRGAALKQADYQPPFPNRIDLFAAPKRQGNRRVIADGELKEMVELIGFVNVRGPRVVLSINGLETPFAEGESRDGIKVISIHPPGVVLQQGRQRWQATLAN